MYGLPKVHKDGVSMRPVLSMIHTSQNNIAKYLDKKIKSFIPNDFICKDSFEFVNSIANFEIRTENDFMVSFDVSSLFTNVLLQETIELCCELWRKNNLDNSDLDEVAFRKLLTFATSNVHFLFNDEWYKQIDGVAMGSPLAPTLASIFLSSIEEKIELFLGKGPLLYKRYVDDIFLVFESREHFFPFLDYMNSIHPNIIFTLEQEINGKLPFLDLLIERKNDHYETEIYRKKTDTGLYTSINSFCEFKYKRNMIKGLLYRSWSLSSTFSKSIKSIDTLSKLLNNNGYSKSIIDRLTRETVDKIIEKEKINNEQINSLNIENCFTPGYTLSLPYSEGFK